jgi:hypothetical protein
LSSRSSPSVRLGLERINLETGRLVPRPSSATAPATTPAPAASTPRVHRAAGLAPAAAAPAGAQADYHRATQAYDDFIHREVVPHLGTQPDRATLNQLGQQLKDLRHELEPLFRHADLDQGQRDHVARLLLTEMPNLRATLGLKG